MANQMVPEMFGKLCAEAYIAASDILRTSDGFFLVYKSLANILADKGIFDVPSSNGERLACNRFFDDWFLYAVPNESAFTYSLVKLREQEYDAQEDIPADGDTPGVTISFIAFDCRVLMRCLADPTDQNRKSLNIEINRVVAYRKQRHHKALKRYFKNPMSQGAFLVAATYIKHIASFAENGCLAVPEQYKEIVRKHIACKNAAKYARLPAFIAALNQKAGSVICDNETIYIQNSETPSVYEAAAILATHTGNTSVFSFAAEVEYHARFLTALAKIKIPFVGKSVYDSAIRADMTVGDTEFQGPAPFYREKSGIVKRQYALHHEKENNYV